MMQTRRRFWLGLGAACAFAVPVAADPDITVTGQRLDQQAAHAQAVDYVRKLGIAGGVTPAARWIDPVCLEVTGVEPAIAVMVEARFRSVAQQAGARLARPGCRTNALITFTPDAAAYVRKLVAFDGRQFEETTSAQFAALREGKAPIRWWYRTNIRGADGDGGLSVPPSGMQIVSDGDAASTGANTDGGPRQNVIGSRKASLIVTQGKREIKGAAVVIDANLATGKPLSAVGDFAALVLLAEVQPPPVPPSGSILALFQPGQAAVDQLTGQDQALLKSLYTLPLARDARMHRGRLVGDLTKAAMGDVK